jgi:hypothetical protein
MSPVREPFDEIGGAIVESLQGVNWRSAWLWASMDEPGVMSRRQRYVDDGDGIEKDFVLRGAMRVMSAVEAHAAETAAKGFPAWSALTFRLDRSGEFKVEYEYGQRPGR